MRNLIIILIVILAACNQDTQVLPEIKPFNLEVAGSYQGTFYGTPLEFKGVEAFSYTINVEVNGLSHFYHIDTLLTKGFVGAIFKKEIQAPTNAKIQIRITDNFNTGSGYFYADVYKHINFRNKSELKEITDIKFTNE